MTPTPLRAKALAVLREGRLTLLHVRSDDAHTVTEAVGKVQSSRPGDRVYAVDYVDGVWDCTCGKRDCPHIGALRMVTGHGTAELAVAAS